MRILQLPVLIISLMCLLNVGSVRADILSFVGQSGRTYRFETTEGQLIEQKIEWPVDFSSTYSLLFNKELNSWSVFDQLGDLVFTHPFKIKNTTYELSLVQGAFIEIRGISVEKVLDKSEPILDESVSLFDPKRKEDFRPLE